MKTLTAVTLNIVYPGAGYLYLKDSFRRQIAIFLVAVWTLLLGAILYQLIRGLFTGDSYFFMSPIEIPFIAVAMWCFMCVDTYFLAKKSKGKSTKIIDSKA